MEYSRDRKPCVFAAEDAVRDLLDMLRRVGSKADLVMDEAKTPPGHPGDRSQAAAEKLRALRERANQALDDHRQRLSDLESQLNDRVHQLAEEFGGEGAPPPDLADPSHSRDTEVAELRRQLEEGRLKHEKFVEQLAMARRQLDALQLQPCQNCQKAADDAGAAQDEIRLLRQELETATRQHQEERARHDKFVVQLSQARQALSELQSASGDRAAELVTELEAVQADNAALAAELESLRAAESDVAVELAAELDSARTANAALAAELDSLRGAKTELASEAESSRSAKAELTAELETLRAAKADLEGRLAASSRDLDILHVEFDQLSARAASLDKDLAAAQASSQSLQAQVGELEKLRAADVVEIERLGGLSAAGAEGVRQAQTTEAALREQAALLEAALKQAQGERDELARKHSELATAKASLDAALDNIKSAGDAEQVRLAECQAAAQRELDSLGARLAAAVAEKHGVEKSLSEMLTAQQELRASLESAARELARVQEQAAAGAGLQVQLEQAHTEIKQLRTSAETQKESEEQLQQKFDLALADVQKLKRESAALREELSRRPEANDQETPELIAVRSERDALILRIGELEAAAAKADDLEAQQAREDQQRRFEMAVDDVRQLKQENVQLREKLAAASKGAAAAPATLPSGELDWAAQRARLMALLEEEEQDGPVGADRKKERATIEGTISATDLTVAELEHQITELRAQLTASDATCARQDEHGRARLELLDADEVIAVERKRIAELETQWEDKVRSAELEISVERARLAREQAALKERLLELELGLPQAAAEDGGDAKPRRRWLAALGLGDEAEEPKKKK